MLIERYINLHTITQFLQFPIEINIYIEVITLTMDILASKEKTIGLVLAIVGILGLIVSASWDAIQGKETSMGALQYGGIAGGVILLIIGLVIMAMMGGTVEQKREPWEGPPPEEKPPETPEEQPPEQSEEEKQ